MIGYVIAGLVGVIAILLMWLGYALDKYRRLDARVKELKDAKDDLQQRLADMVATVELVFSDDPDLDGDDGDELREEIAAASGALSGDGRGGLSAVEQAAADRIRGAAATRS